MNGDLKIPGGQAARKVQAPNTTTGGRLYPGHAAMAWHTQILLPAKLAVVSVQIAFRMACRRSVIMNVVLCGPSGSGKTTLAERLLNEQELIGYVRINEVARDVMKAKQLTRADLEKSLSTDRSVFRDLQWSIAREQCERERCLESSNQPSISDRGPDYLVYTLLHIGEPELRRLARQDDVQESLRRYRQSLVVLVAPHTQIAEDDGTRLAPSHVEHDLFRGVLVRFRVNFLDLCDPDLGRRVGIVKSALESKQEELGEELGADKKSLANIEDRENSCTTHNSTPPVESCMIASHSRF